jgi:hypothetical protein
MDTVATLRVLAAMLAVLLFYFLPFVVALARHHRAKLAIFLTNLLLGVTGIGWLVALIWAFNGNVAPRVPEPLRQ